MNKKDAAIFLEVGVRTLERWASEKGKLGYSIKKNENNRDYIDYNDDDLKRIKQQMQNEIIVPSSVLANVDEGGEQVHWYERLLSYLIPLLKEQTRSNLILQASFEKPQIPLNEKLLLSLKEASRLSGIPYSQINEAVKSNALKAVKVGRGRHVRRKDLLAYVDTLFDVAA